MIRIIVSQLGMAFMARIFLKLVGVLIFHLRGGVACARWKGVKVGEGCRIYVRDFGTEPFLISLGDRVTVAQGCVFLTHDGSTWLVRDTDGERYFRFLPISVGSDVFIGANSLIMPGVRIGSRVVIGAGSVITRDVPDGVITAGNPAREIGLFSDYENKIKSSCPKEGDLKGADSYMGRVSIALNFYFRRQFH